VSRINWLAVAGVTAQIIMITTLLVLLVRSVL
jgi:hypothetical protein